MSTLLLPSASLAVETDSAADVEGSAGPGWSFMDVTLMLNDLSRRPVLAVGGLLDESVPLPATVHLPVPKGADVMWAGEIHGDTVAEDVELPYEVREGGSYDLVMFTLDGSRRAQVEVAQPEALVDSGESFTARMRWVADSAADTARYAVAMPSWVEVRSTPPDVRRHEGMPGVVYLYREVTNLRAGEELSLEVDFVIPAGARQDTGAGEDQGGDPSILWGVTLIVAITGVVMAVIAYSSRRRASDASTATDPSIRSDDSSITPDAPTTDAAEEPPSQSGAGKKLLMVAIPVAFAAMAYSFSMGGATPGGLVREGSAVRTEISDAEPAAAYRTRIVIPCECPPEVEAQELFGDFEQVDGVSAASLDTESLLLEVSYDPSRVTQERIVDVLRGRGMLP